LTFLLPSSLAVIAKFVHITLQEKGYRKNSKYVAVMLVVLGNPPSQSIHMFWHARGLEFAAYREGWTSVFLYSGVGFFISYVWLVLEEFLRASSLLLYRLQYYSCYSIATLLLRCYYTTCHFLLYYRVPFSPYQLDCHLPTT
jgi:hypothetical protein